MYFSPGVEPVGVTVDVDFTAIVTVGVRLLAGALEQRTSISVLVGHLLSPLSNLLTVGNSDNPGDLSRRVWLTIIGIRFWCFRSFQQ